MVKTSDVLAALKADLKAAEIKKRDLDAIQTTYRNEYYGKPYGNEVKGRSQIISRDIKRQSEWQHASIIDPFVSTPDIIKCNPVTWEDRKAAEQNELILNTQFCRQFDRFNFMTKALKVLDREGTLIVQLGWEYEDEEKEVDVPVYTLNHDTGTYEQTGTRKEMQTVIKYNQPTAKVCRNEDIYIDPTCMDNMDACQFIIYRYETNLSMLKQDGRYKNLDKIVVGMNEAANSPDNYYPEDKTHFRFRDEPRKKIIVHEYWGFYDMNEDGIAEPIVCVWANDVIIRLESNPYPDQKIPFLVVPFISVPHQMQGEANAELLSDTQKVKTAILRGIIDNMAQSTNAQKGIKKGTLDVVNRKRFLNGDNFEFNGTPNDFFEGNYNEIPGSAFNMFTLMNNEAESMTGIKSFNQGINGNSLGGTATGARGAMDATATRRLNIVRNIAENLVKPLLRRWMTYNTEFLDATQVVRMTNDEFVEIHRDDLAGNIDIDIQVSTSEDNATKAQELGFMMQTLGQTMDPGMRNILMAQIFRLHKMPDLAKQIMEYKPEPDPLEVQLKQLEIAKLQAEINERNMRAQEIQVKMGLEDAKRQNELAKARHTSSKADNEDLSFLEKESGADKQHELDKAQLQHNSAMDQQAMQLMHNSHQAELDRDHDTALQDTDQDRETGE